MSHRTPSLGPTPLRIERRCPGCGAELRYSEADHAAACGHCGLHVAVLRREGGARFAIRARGDETSWSLAAKRMLRDRGVRLRELSIPWLVYAPFYRLSASIHSWWRTGSSAARAELAEVTHGEDAWPAWVLSGMVSAFHETSANAYTRIRPRIQAPREAEQSVHFRIGDWEQTLDGAPSIDLGDCSLGVRSRVLQVTPIEELIGDTDAESTDTTATDARATPARLACELDPAEARRRLELSLVEAQRPIDCDPDAARAVVRQRPMQVIYHPYVVVEYRGPDGDGAAILDGLTARPRALLDLTALDQLRERLEARPGEPSAWSFAEPDESLTALVCDQCTAPLDCPAGAKLFVCPLCDRVFEATTRGIQQIEAIGLRAPVGAARGARPRSLPFYRFTVPVEAGPTEAGARTVFLPAALARHPRALWSLSAAFSRRGREWRDGDPDEPVETPIALSPEEARPLLPFLWSLAFDEPELEDDRVAQAVIELVWISVVRRGRDWVEPSSGLGVASSALGAWSVEPRVS